MNFLEFKEKYNNLQIPSDSYIYDAMTFLLKDNRSVLDAKMLSKYKYLTSSIILILLEIIDVSEEEWISIIDLANRLEKNSIFS